MADLRSVISAAHDDAVDAFNCCAEVVDFLDVVDMALAYHDCTKDPFSQITTVLSRVRKIAVEGREAALRANNALSKEMRV